MYQRYQPILGVRPLRRLLISSVIGRLPLGTAALSVLLLVRAATHDYAQAGLSVGALAGAEACLAPVVGGWLDRFGALRVISLAAVLQAAALVVLATLGASHPTLVLVLGVSAVIGAAMPPVSGASRALWPRLLSERVDRDAAFSLDAIGQELVWTAGPVVVGFVATTISARLAVLMVAAITLLTSAWFLRAVLALGERAGILAEVAGGAAAGLARITRVLTPVTALMGLSLGGTEVVLPALATHLHHTSLSGVLLALWAVGSMGGGILFGARHWTIPRERLLPWMLVGNGLLVVPVMLSHALVPAMAASFFAGICIAPSFSCMSSLIGEHAPPEATALAFNWNTAAIVAGAAIGSAVCGAIVASSGVTAALAVACGAGLLGGAVAFSLVLSVPRTGLSAV